MLDLKTSLLSRLLLAMANENLNKIANSFIRLKSACPFERARGSMPTTKFTHSELLFYFGSNFFRHEKQQTKFRKTVLPPENFFIAPATAVNVCLLRQ
jgi:predicted N-acyltransferase